MTNYNKLMMSAITADTEEEFKQAKNKYVNTAINEVFFNCFDKKKNDRLN